jgi:hypothetical protein
MAWIYLAESADWPSHSSPGSRPSLTVRVTDTPRLVCCRVCDREIFPPLPSGTMCEHCDGLQTWQASISSMADSLVRTSALQAMAEAWKESEADFSLKSSDLRENSSRVSYFWKTCLQFGRVDSIKLSNSLPAWGMIADGRPFLPLNLEPRILGHAGSCFLPTPSASSYGSNRGGAAGRTGKVRPSLGTLAKQGELPGHPRGQLSPEWIEPVMGYLIGWTELGDLETQWFRQQRGKRSCA